MLVNNFDVKRAVLTPSQQQQSLTNMQEPAYTLSSEHCDALHALSLVAIDLLQSERRASVAVVETVPLVHAFTPLSWYQGFFAERPTESAESADTLSETSEHDLVSAEETSSSLDASDAAATISATASDPAPSPTNSLKRQVSQVSLSGVKRHCGATHAIPSISASISTKHKSKLSQQQLPKLKVQIPRRQSTDSSLTALNYYDLDAAGINPFFPTLSSKPMIDFFFTSIAPFPSSPMFGHTSQTEILTIMFALPKKNSTPPGTRSPSIPPSPTFSVYYPSSPAAEATLAFQTAPSSRRLSSVSSTSSSALAPASPRLKSRANFNQAVLEILTGWLEDHKEDPYPSVEQKKMLADQCGLNMKQVNNWFINARRRRLV
ncbi:hypothetical protein CcCBS67573_g06471 [Chytriomyces confervae]|uniref:Homeobox domain-containing protein n=1 Tax=Chytriomyces confervae TaxID=246404 RepID=A0A507F522_9FUNG|nr:hypothetical protein CcCBS67573_g06471 [Chytriomyces confervae]